MTKRSTALACERRKKQRLTKEGMVNVREDLEDRDIQYLQHMEKLRIEKFGEI